MSYFTKPKNRWSIRVTFEKSTNQWKTEKFKGKNLVRSAFGLTVEQAMLHTTMDGLEPDQTTIPASSSASTFPSMNVEVVNKGLCELGTAK